MYQSIYRKLRRAAISARSVALLLLTGSSVSVSLAQTTYYVSGSGDDKRSGRSEGEAVQTIARINSLTLQPGDQVLFRRGDTFRGTLTIRQSGAANQPIVIDAYGSGNKPLLAGSTLVTGWNNIGNNVWQASCPSCGNTVTGVYRNGTALPLGRYPNLSDANKGYLTVQSHSGKTQFTSQQGLPANFTGGEAVVRPVLWVLDRATITSQSGNALSIANNSNYNLTDGWGYFIQNHPATLDQTGEWYYNPGDKSIRLYDSQTNPNTQSITATTFSEVINLTGVSNIAVRNVQLSETITTSLDINSSSNVTVSGCAITNAGTDGILIQGSGSNVLMENNLLQDINNNGVSVGNYPNVTFRGNTMQRVALAPGRGGSGDGTYSGLQSRATANFLIENNVLDQIGYNGISLFSNTTVRNNVISNFCVTKSDGSGIYSWNGDGTNPGGNRIMSNVVFNGPGAPEGTISTAYAGANGIFLDDCSRNAEIVNNTVFNVRAKGILLRATTNVVVTGNTSYNNDEEQIRLGYNQPCDFRNNKIQDNVFVSRTANQLVADYESYANDLNQYGSFDNNYYARPFEDQFKIQAVWNPGTGLTGKVLTLAEWQSRWNQDRNSGGSPFTYKPQIVTQTGATLLDNAFANGTNSWGVWSAAGNGRIDWDNTNRLDGGSLKMYFASASGQAKATAIATVSIGTIRKGQTYQLLLDGIASMAGKRIQLYLRQNYGPYSDLTARSSFTLTTNRQTIETTFTATADEPNTILVMEFEEDGQTAWLDNIRLKEATLTAANPDDYIKFLYNPTAQAKTESVSGNYRDVKNRQYSGQVAIAPFSSIVLFKEVSAATAPTPTPVPVSLRDPENPANTTNGLDYQYYEGSWSVLPDFNSLSAAKTGTTGQAALSVRGRDTNYGLRFTGYFNAPADGTYTFYTTSDDGSKLYIGNTELVNNDGQHGDQEKSGSIGLKAGKHAITVTYFQGGYGQTLTVSYEGPTVSKQTIPVTSFYRIPSTATTPAPTGSGVYLSDLSWTSVSNGYGPVEKDRSNGDAAAGDGRTITLNGQTYAKGLGVHAASSISYKLGGQYTQFITDMGIDDEMSNDNCGKAEFQIFVDGNKVYSSGNMTPSSATKSVTLDVVGKQTLTLVVTDGGDGLSCDHGDWANARLIPASANASAQQVPGGGSGTGLRADYYNNASLTAPIVLTRRDNTVNFEWGDGTPAAGTINSDYFSVRWTGQVEAPVTGSYLFYTNTDDGVRLWINGVQVINDWNGHAPQTNASTGINLTAGQRYDIRMDYFDNSGGAVAKLLWSYPGQSQQTIPQNRLYPASGAGRQAAVGAEVVSSPLLVYPVPAQETVWVRYDAAMAGTATIQLINSAGQSVSQTSHAVEPGENLIRLDVNALNRGNYVLILVDGTRRETRKLILTE